METLEINFEKAKPKPKYDPWCAWYCVHNKFCRCLEDCEICVACVKDGKRLWDLIDE